MTQQDDMARMLTILADAPLEGMSLDEIQAATMTGEKWSLRTINDVLVSLGRQVRNEKIRMKTGRKVIKYSLRNEG